MTRLSVLRLMQTAIDVIALSIAFWLAFQLRFDWQVPSEMLRRLVLMWPYVIVAQYGLLSVMGITHFSWRYIGLREVTRILGATVITSTLLGLARLALPILPLGHLARYFYLPFGVIAINLVLAFVGTVGVRVLRRLGAERSEVYRLRPDDRASLVPTLLVGAGQGGVMVAKEIAARPELGILPVGFIDDDTMKLGSVINGVRVLGATADIGRLARELGVSQAIITIANAPGSTVRAISGVCQDAGLRVKIIPGLYQLVGGEINLTRMQDVAIEDLLRREPVRLDESAISEDLKGKIVLVSGAGGSIGSEICRQICRFGPKLLVLLERSENALFEVHRELGDTFPNIATEPCLADICDAQRITEVFSLYRPEVVFHAAAHKHVPMMEWNPCEAVKNNVFGTKTLADCASDHSAGAFVLISTDKAVNPASVMGVTKRVTELYVQSMAETSHTRFVIVRFGNVLGSNGSVVRIFKEQIARGGPVTVTHPEMTRYFMTIPEACRLVLQAATMGDSGKILILDMGEPIKVIDLASDLIRLSGIGVDEIEIQFTGIRPGEKLHEELSVAEEGAERTQHPKILVARTRAGSLEHLRLGLARLAEVARMPGSPAALRQALRAIVPEYEIRELPASGASAATHAADANGAVVASDAAAVSSHVAP